MRALSIDDCQGLCDALMLSNTAATTTAATTKIRRFSAAENEQDDSLTADESELLQYQAAVLISHAAELGHTAKLLDAGVVRALLTTLETAQHPEVRAATATALRTLCRDADARQAAATAGCLRPLARQLQSPNAAPRRAAARAVTNVVMKSEAWKREAVEKFSICHSLVAMLRVADDPLGQEVAAAALANLAANNEAVQSAICKNTDIFASLSEVLTRKNASFSSSSSSSSSSNNNTVAAQFAAARAIRNLTSRVHYNRLKAAAAVGIVPGLVLLLSSADAAARTAGASALATLLDGCSDGVAQALAAGAGPQLVDMLVDGGGGDLASRDAAVCALAHLNAAAAAVTSSSNNGGGGGANNTASTTENIHNNNNRTTPSLPPMTTAFRIDMDTAPALIALLSTASPLGRRAAARLLTFLASKKCNKDELVTQGAIPPLIGMLSASQDGLRRAAVTALCALMHRCDLGRQQFMQTRGSSSSSSSLSSPFIDSNTTTTTATTSTLINGGIAALVALLRKGESEEEITRQEASRAIGILCANNHFRQGEAAHAAGAIPALVSILGGDSTTPAAGKEAAAVALSNLACLPSNQAALAAAGAGPMLLRLLRSEAPPQCRHSAARALSNMVADGMPAELSPALSEMVQLLSALAAAAAAAKDDDGVLGGAADHHQDQVLIENVQVAAATALGNISCADARGAAAVATYGGAAALAHLCRSSAPPVREAATQGLWEACRGSAEARRVAIAQGVIAWLVHLLLVGEDPTKEAAAGCLAELTRNGGGACVEAEKAGAERQLQRLVDDGENEEVSGAAAVALRALKHRSPHSPSVESELSQRLSSLRQAGSKVWVSGGDGEQDTTTTTANPTNEEEEFGTTASTQ